jgi:sugar phosphate isomerase/epimerase/predicted metal-dependent hydrolase
MLQTSGEHDAAFLRGVVGEAVERGVRVHAFHSFQEYFPLFTPYARRTEEAFAAFARLFEVAGELGVPVVVWHGPRRQQAPAPDQWGPFLDMTRRLALEAHAAGVTLALENVSWCALATVRDCFAFANRLPELGPAGSMGFAFDPFQAAEAGANPFMILNAMAGAVVDVHLSDAREDDGSARHLLPGEGDLPWAALVRAIAGSGFSGAMMVEGPLDREGAGWRRVRGLIEPLIAQLDLEGTDAPLPAGVIEGIELFNRGEWYEAHEALEHEWHAERGEVRRLWQGILQIGVGLHHARSGNHRGAVLLLTDGIEKTAAFTPSYRGLDTARLVRDAQACLDQVIALGPGGLQRFDWTAVPVIELPHTSEGVC